MDCRNSPDCGQAGLPAEGSLMRRPLFMACLCLVIVLAIGRILTGADTGDAGVLPPDGSPVRITGRIDTRTSETIILKSISIIQNDLKYSYSFCLSGCIGLVKTWLTSDTDETPQYMAQLTFRLIMNALRHMYPDNTPLQTPLSGSKSPLPE